MQRENYRRNGVGRLLVGGAAKDDRNCGCTSHPHDVLHPLRWTMPDLVGRRTP
jgi:hypothetical protein